VIKIDALRLTYPPTVTGEPPRHVLDGLSFEVGRGACTAITGASGCGTTSLCMAVAGLAPRLTGGQIEGRIVVGGRDVQGEPPGALADLLGVALEDPAGQLFNPSVADEIAWGLENLGIPPVEMPGRIRRALALVDLGDVPLDQPPHTLSGGQQRRLALAAALALEPRVLILDRPSGGLSPAARAELVAVLRDLRAEQGLTILLAENDPAVIIALADELLILDKGQIAAQGAPANLYPAFDVRRFPGVSVPPAGVFAHVVNSLRGEAIMGPLTCLTLEQAVDQVSAYRLNGASPPIQPSEWTPVLQTLDEAIHFDGLTFGYQPDQPILDDLTLAVPRGQFVAITGDNGAGKTTLARHVIGLLRPSAGRVLLFGQETAHQPVSRLARQVGYAFQNPELQIFNPTVREEITFGPRNLNRDAATLSVAFGSALQRFGLAASAASPPAMLSFSARRLVALAGIATMDTPILVLDEPTVGLDADGQARIDAWLSERQAAGTTILLITHDMELVARHADRVVVMESGRIAADGSSRQVFARAALLAEAGLEPPFAAGFAARLGRPDLSGDLTPDGAARAWLEHLV
jgi:energy-coupling factor transport system ATP-binding protein